jgi:hypothetical protein
MDLRGGRRISRLELLFIENWENGLDLVRLAVAKGMVFLEPPLAKKVNCRARGHGKSYGKNDIRKGLQQQSDDLQDLQ